MYRVICTLTAFIGWSMNDGTKCGCTSESLLAILDLTIIYEVYRAHIANEDEATDEMLFTQIGETTFAKAC